MKYDNIDSKPFPSTTPALSGQSARPFSLRHLSRFKRSGSGSMSLASRTSFAAIAALLATSVPLVAQQTSGSIFGTVQDATGAIVPNAIVVATAPLIGATRTVKSGSNGTFTIPNLPDGTYNIKITATGFQTSEKSGVILAAPQNLNAGNFSLVVGSEAQTITVAADSATLQLQTDSGERSDIVTNKQLNDVALNGRNVLDILRIIPGVSGSGAFAVSQTGGLNTLSINGTRTNEHDFTIDGSSNVDSGDNGGTQVTINPDAIAEVQVLTSNFQAQFGKAGGGSIVVTTRGGTNDFHGNVHFFHRNEGMNANDWVSNRDHTAKQLFRYNTPGAEIGGPIKRDKLFFFFSTEWFRQLIPGGISKYQTPTALERNGDFSQSVGTDLDKFGNPYPIQIYDPVTRAAVPGNVIHPATLTAQQQANYAQIQKILNLYPLPNVTGEVYNRADPLSYQLPRTEYIGRLDYQISPSERIFARYTGNRSTQTAPVGNFGIECYGSLEVPGGCTDKSPSFNVTVDLTSTLKPNLLNELTLAPSAQRSTVVGVNGNITVGANSINLPLLYPVTPSTSIPDLSFSGNGRNYPGTYFGSTPWFQANTNITANDNLTWIVKSHTMKFGAFYERSRKDQISYGNSNGQFGFNACSTSAEGCVNGVPNAHDGSPIASALLGYFTSFGQSNARPTGHFRYNQVEFYAQDTWQVSQRLTLDYGIRFVYIPPQYDTNNQVALFEPAAYNPATAVKVTTGGNVIPNSGNTLDGMQFASNGTLPKGGWNSQGIMPEPRFGFSWDPYGDHKGVIRGGFGTSHDREQGNLIFNTVFSNPANVTTTSISNSNLVDLATTAPNAAGVLTNVIGAERSGQVPVVYSYSLGIQREVLPGTVLDVSYVSTLGRHLVQQHDANALPYGTTFQRAAQDPSTFPGGVVPTVEPNLPPEYAAKGLSFSGQHAYTQNYLLPFKGYGQIPFLTFDGTSNYNALQVTVQRRYSRSLTLGGTYTWSKAMTTSSSDQFGVDPFNQKLYSYGVAGYDRRSVAAINYVYSLPDVSKQLHASHLVGLLTDGYQLSSITSLQTGFPVRNAVYLPANQVTGGSQYSATPPLYVGLDQQGNPLLPTIGAPTQSAPGSLRDGNLVAWDQSIFKNFALGPVEKGRSIQLRGEFFNIINHPNFYGHDYGVNYTLPSYDAKNDTFIPLSAQKSGTFGKRLDANGPTGPGGPRVIQLAAKVYF